MTLKLTKDLEDAIAAIARLTEPDSKTIAASLLVDRLETARDIYPHDQIIVNMSESIKASLDKDPFRMLSASDVQNYFNHFASLGPSDNIRSVLGEFLVDHRVKQSTKADFGDERSWGTNITRDLTDVVEDKQPIEVRAMASEADVSQKGDRSVFGSEENNIFGSLSESILRNSSRYSDKVINETIKFAASEFNSIFGQVPSIRFIEDSSDAMVLCASLNAGGRTANLIVEVPLTKSARPLPITQYKVAGTDFVREFTASNISSDISSPDHSSKVYDIKYSTMDFNSLIRELYVSASNGETESVNAIIESVQSNFPEKMSIAVDNLTDALQKFSSNNKPKAKCSRIVPAGKYSVVEKCGHLRIPLDQVHTDEHGNCRRKSLSVFDATESSNVSIASSKINLT